ncbi:MAG: hypothetical protein QM589_02075 [Thermomicrobiales bacterium]
MVTSPRPVVIHDGQIRLPDDMLEKSGIGKSDGVVMLDQQDTGEIVVRASSPQENPLNLPPSERAAALVEPDGDPESIEYQVWLVQRSAGILHDYLDDVLVPFGIADDDLPSHWRSLAEEAIADEMIASMENAKREDDIH